MSKFTDFVDSVKDQSEILAKDELKNLVATAKKDKSDFVRLKAENLERWTVMMAEEDLTPDGFKKLVRKMEVLSQLENIRLDTAARASAQRLAEEYRTWLWINCSSSYDSIDQHKAMRQFSFRGSPRRGSSCCTSVARPEMNLRIVEEHVDLA
jgi:hypothetical protein